MGFLQEMGKKFATDKTDIRHNGKSYLDFYEPYFLPFRGSLITMLELGVKDGGSLKLWQSYFPNSNIIGIDIDPARKIHEGGRIEIVICSQNDASKLNALANKYGGFDIVLDDASHVNDLTVKSFDIIKNHLKKGGLYIFEDMGCSYDGDLRPWINLGHWPGMNYNPPETNWINDRKTMNDLFNEIIKNMDKLENKKCEWEFMHFYPMTTVLKKSSV
jgi:hypothetical protein